MILHLFAYENVNAPIPECLLPRKPMLVLKLNSKVSHARHIFGNWRSHGCLETGEHSICFFGDNLRTVQWINGLWKITSKIVKMETPQSLMSKEKVEPVLKAKKDERMETNTTELFDIRGDDCPGVTLAMRGDCMNIVKGMTLAMIV